MALGSDENLSLTCFCKRSAASQAPVADSTSRSTLPIACGPSAARGNPGTSLPRTLLDLAATVRFDWLEKMVERAEELELLNLRAVEDLLARTVGHHGHGRLRKAISLYKPTSFTRSGLEKRWLELVLAAGLPQPRMNYVERGFELDCYWPEHRFAVELDLFETHGTRAAFERDRVRQEELLLAGITMTRVTGPRLEREPDEVIRRVARLLEQAGRR